MQVSLLHIASLASASPLAPVPVELPEIVMAAPVLLEGAALPAQEIVPPGPITIPDATAEPATETVTEADPAADMIIVTGAALDTPGDPLENLNATTFEISQKVDAALVEPIAEAYDKALPDPLRAGLRNFLQNLLEPVNFINGLLQLKPDLAFAALGRFAINSTIGIGGLIDVAGSEEIGLTYRRNGFANTMAYYGVDEGAFLVVPLVGATTVRDLVGTTLDQAFVPFLVGPPLTTPYYAVPAYTVNSLEFRTEFDDRIDAINASDDPYAAMRASYLCLRRADIADLRGEPLPDCSLEVLLAEEDEDDEDFADEDGDEVGGEEGDAAVPQG